MPYAAFGPGTVIVKRIDIASQSPINIGFANEFSADESAETKENYGQNQYPLAIARGTIKSTGKIKAAQISGLALNAVMHGANFSVGSLRMAQGEVGIIAMDAVTVANAANFDTDLGVTYIAGVNAGLPLIAQPAGTAQATLTVGQYTVTAAGAYTFSTADQTAQTALGASPLVAFTYAWKSPTVGQTKLVTNQPIGFTPVFQLDYYTVENGQGYYARFFSCVSSKLSQAFKLTDFMMPEIDFGFFANAAGNVYEVSYAQVS